MTYTIARAVLGTPPAALQQVNGPEQSSTSCSEIPIAAWYQTTAPPFPTRSSFQRSRWRLRGSVSHVVGWGQSKPADHCGLPLPLPPCPSVLQAEGCIGRLLLLFPPWKVELDAPVHTLRISPVTSVVVKCNRPQDYPMLARKKMLKLNIGRRGLRTIVTTVGSYRACTKVKPANVWMGCCVGTYAPNCTLLSSTRVLSVRTAVVLLRKAVRALCLFSLVRLARNVVCRRPAGNPPGGIGKR